jgi:CDP-diacylglycerol---serine O-phosphatidyltransferase
MRYLPNILTCCHLLCGCLGLLALLGNDPLSYPGPTFYDLILPGMFIITGAIFDFLDGFAARLLKAYSPIGQQLDSLADLVTFGLLPSFVLYQLLHLSLVSQRYQAEIWQPDYGGVWGIFLVKWPLLALAVAVFSALRLAKFNVDERQTDQFIGLPTPANALVVASLPFIVQSRPELSPYIINPIALSVYVVVVSGLMVAELPLFALKFRHFRWPGNELRYSFLLASATLLAVFQIAAIPLIVALYVLLSIIFNKRTAPATHS